MTASDHRTRVAVVTGMLVEFPDLRREVIKWLRETFPEELKEASP